MRFRTNGEARTTLAAGAFFFVAAQMLFNVVADTRHPELFDSEYGVRLSLLQARQAEAPGRPLLLLMGSSRTVAAFRPETLPEMQTADGTRVLPFNYSHLAAGPILTLMEYQRLRRAGVRPEWLVVEVMPPCLSLENPAQAVGCMTVFDLALLQRYFDWSMIYGRYIRFRLIPWYRHRGEIVRRLAPAWTAPGSYIDSELIHLAPLGGDDHWSRMSIGSPDLIRRASEAARADYVPRLQQFSIKKSATRAYGELITKCHTDGVRLVLLLTPESTEFRSWYSAESLRQIDDWCSEMRRQYGVQIIDARAWVADSDFMDGHHVLDRGADAFTKRLGEEVLRPLVRGGEEKSMPAAPD